MSIQRTRYKRYWSLLRCRPGHDNSCRRRFGWKWGELPEGYDHKYVYSHVGYNLKITDMQAAVGVAQLDRLPGFAAARRDNYHAWLEELDGLEDRLRPFRPSPGADPCWFGLALTVCDPSPGLRERVLLRLNEQRIGTRLLFAGNIIKQPAYAGRTYRVAGGLENTDAVMTRTFWVGLYPGLSREQIARAAAVLRGFWA
jgi:CDP-6-deoxy-D-xylo-4-hexulose-3-dehydrase